MNESPERSITRERILLGLGAASLICAVAMWVGQTLLAAGCVSLILTLAASLGALQNGRLGPFKPYFLAALVAWLLAFTLMHLLPADTESLWLGFPPATAISIYLLWLAPLLLVTLPYTLLFDRAILTAEDLAALREEFGEAAVEELAGREPPP